MHFLIITSESQSKSGTKMVYPEPCTGLRSFAVHKLGLFSVASFSELISVQSQSKYLHRTP